MPCLNYILIKMKKKFYQVFEMNTDTIFIHPYEAFVKLLTIRR